MYINAIARWRAPVDARRSERAGCAYRRPDIGTDFIWQDLLPDLDHPLVNEVDIAALKKTVLRGRRNGARVVRMEKVQATFDTTAIGGKKISMAGLIVLAGSAATEMAAHDGGHDVTGPFVRGRMNAKPQATDPEQMDYLQPVADGFRTYHTAGVRFDVPLEHLFLDRAALMTLTAPASDCQTLWHNVMMPDRCDGPEAGTAATAIC